MESKEEIIKDILSHKYFVHGRCIHCGTEFERCTNSRGLKSSCCSDDCFKEFKAERTRRGKERHHYEVFKDGRYYYIKEDGKFIDKRTHKGKTWRLEEQRDKLDTETPILNPNEKIPSRAIKIIDKVSAYLYDKEHYFDDWKNLKNNLKNKEDESKIIKTKGDD